MRNMTLKNIAEAVKGVLYTEDILQNDNTEAAGVVIDSRKVAKDYVFIATRGEHVDGHRFIDQVFDAGALGVICEKAPDASMGNYKGPYILVEDSFQALKDLAEYYRKQLDIKVVGITGSVGKTSTKEFVASVLSKGYPVLKTQGNFNNEIGLPLTVLQIREECRIAVLEMGISDFGEMHRLSKIARPDVCLITNIGQCHLENLGTRDGILKAKTEIFDFMQEGGQVCLNGDDDKLAAIKSVKGCVPVFFGISAKGNAVYADQYENRGLMGSRARIHIKTGVGRAAAGTEGETDFEINIPLPGEHMLYNALAAAAVGTLFGLSVAQIQAGIRDVEAVGGRSHVIRTDRFTLIDDCYNANPVSMKAAIDLLHMTDVSEIAGVIRMPDDTGVSEAAGVLNASNLATFNLVASNLHVSNSDAFNEAKAIGDSNVGDVLGSSAQLGLHQSVRKVAILGDMFELGADEAALHREVGAYAAEKKIDVIICVGPLCKHMYHGALCVANAGAAIYYYADKAALFAEIDDIIHEGDIVLVKASHGMHFEEIIERLS